MPRIVYEPNDWGATARDRINKKIDGFDDLQSREEFDEKLDKFLNDNPGWENMRKRNTNKHKTYKEIRDMIYEEGGAKEVVEKNQESLHEALLFESQRVERARLRDESSTHKRTKVASWKSVRSWKVRPGGSDILGVDTRVGFRSRQRVRTLARRVKLSKRDKMLRQNRVFVNPFSLTKVYQSVKTGRFVKYSGRLR